MIRTILWWIRWAFSIPLMVGIGLITGIILIIGTAQDGEIIRLDGNVIHRPLIKN